MSEKTLCCFCRLPRADQSCGICADDVCRGCAERVGDDMFTYLEAVPPELQHPLYCPRCFDSVVAPARTAYLETLERAKKVGFWARAYRGHIPVLKKAQRWIEVEACVDRDDAIMRMGFRAAEMGYNGLVLGEVNSRKLRDHGYQKMEWSGKATPCKIDEEALERMNYNEATWRVIPHR